MHNTFAEDDNNDWNVINNTMNRMTLLEAIRMEASRARLRDIVIPIRNNESNNKRVMDKMNTKILSIKDKVYNLITKLHT